MQKCKHDATINRISSSSIVNLIGGLSSIYNSILNRCLDQKGLRPSTAPASFMAILTLNTLTALTLLSALAPTASADAAGPVCKMLFSTVEQEITIESRPAGRVQSLLTQFGIKTKQQPIVFIVEGAAFSTEQVTYEQSALSHLFESYAARRLKIVTVDDIEKQSAHDLAPLRSRNSIQLRTQTSSDDLSLIALAHIDHKPREIGKFVLYGQNHQVVAKVDPFSSFSFNRIDETVMSENLHKLIVRVDPNSGPIGYLELAQVHPIYDFQPLAANGQPVFSVITHELTDADIAYGKKLSLIVKWPVVVRAIVPNGYVYSSVFLNGQDVTASHTQLVKARS
jgi:hypothetical protein